MRLRTSSGSFSGGLGIVGTGVALMFPDAKWLGALLVIAGTLIFVFDVHFERGKLEIG